MQGASLAHLNHFIDYYFYLFQCVSCAFQVRNVFHAPLALLVKGAVVLPEELFIDIIPVAWELLLESDQEVAASAASLFILCAVRAPNHASDVMFHALSNADVTTKINGILR